MNKGVKLAVSLGLVFGAVGYMAYAVSAGESTMTYDKDVAEVVAQPQKYRGKQLRVGGMVVPGSIAKRVVPPRPTEWRFRIMRHGKEMEVHFNGTLAATLPRAIEDAYFKAGCYTQSNPSKGDDATSYGEVVIYALSVQHA